MTIGTETVATSGSSTNGATTSFSFSFPIADYGDTDAEDMVEVILQTTSSGAETILTRGSSAGQYSVSINGDQSASPGGSITTISTYATGYKIWIRLKPLYEQQTDLQNQGAFNAQTVEDQFDHFQRQLLDLQDKFRRAPHVAVPAGASFSGKITGPYTPNYQVKVKSDGTGFDLGAPTSATVGADMASLVASGDITVTGATTAVDFHGWAALNGLWPEQFGAVGDGTTDDNLALVAWLTAVQASNSRLGLMQAKTYATSATIGTITTNNVRLVACGQASSHDVGTQSAGSTVLKAITNTGFVLLTVAPTEGASNQRLDGVKIHGLVFNCNSRATKGLLVKSCFHGEFFVTVIEATTTGFEFDVATTLGEACDTQRNLIRFVGRQFLNAAPALRLKGSATANTSFNQFEKVDIAHYDEIGIIIENADNNIWKDVRCINPGGAALYSVEVRGGTTSATAVRSELFESFSATLPMIVRGFASYAVAAHKIRIKTLDESNGTPNPTVEAGATVIWGTAGFDDYYGPERYNLIVNGDFALNQLAPSSNTDKTAGFDGGVVLTQSNAIALTSVSAPENGQAQCMRMTQSNAAAQRMGYLFVIPSEDSIPLRGKGVALAARIRESSTTDVRVAILEWTGTADAVAGDIVADWTSTTYSTAGFFESTTKNLLAVMENAVAANTWRDISGVWTTGGGLTATVGSSCNNLLVFIWTEGTVAQNVTLDIGQVRLIPGYMPNPSVRTDRAAEIARCRRQVEKSYTLSVAPATSSETGAVKFVNRGAAADQLDHVHVRFSVPKIAAGATVVVYSTTGATGNVRNVTDGDADITAGAIDIGDSGFNVKPTANLEQEKAFAFHFTAAKYPWS